MRYILRPLVLLALVACCSVPAFAQRYTFTHYDIENGLIQSQVNRIYQDKDHRLWMGTLGGACRYDGMDYYAISRATGLINNFVSALFCDRKGNMWMGTNKGLTCLVGQKLIKFTSPPNLKLTWVSRITQDAEGTIWGTMYNHLFKVVGNRLQLEQVDGDNPVTTVTADKQGRIYAGVYQKGIYYREGGSWKAQVTFPDEMKQVYPEKILFDRQDPSRMFLLVYRYVFEIRGNVIKPYATDLLKTAVGPFVSMEQDANNNLWLGTSSGAYCLTPDKLLRFDSRNGFSDAAVTDIYNDSDNNLWLGTNGNGLYRYGGDDHVIYTVFDAAKGNPIVMGLAHDKNNNILLGTDGGGIMQYDGKQTKTIWDNNAMPSSRRVECLYTDRNGTVWVGTYSGGIWRYDGKQFVMEPETEHNSVNSFREDSDGLLWLTSSTGTYYYDKQHVLHSIGLNAFSSTSVALGRDTMLIGTQEGLALVVNKRSVPGFKIDKLSNSAIFCIIRYKNLVLIGTDDAGLFIWDRTTGRVRVMQVSDGLKANSIYSLNVDDHDLLWAGTGRGIDRFALDARSMNFKIMNGSDSKDGIMETNQNTILYHDHKMIFGTTKGLVVYNTAVPTATVAPPHIMISAVKITSQDNSKTEVIWAPDPHKPMVLPYSRNHLDIAFLGVYLRSPESVSYQYRLTGLDDKFSAPVKNDMVDYPSLPPGKYTFEVRAISGDGQLSKNTSTFCFEITPPFYRTYIFQFGVILFLILVGVLIQTIVHRNKIKRERTLEAMKREEKLKIRQQTAEDFHDDLGNKLTRITVLSDILDAKLEPERSEQKKLVLQIKQNAAALYNGTRDILWAMDPKSDNLYEVLNHIKDTGLEIFQDTPVEFRIEGISEDQASIKLPMEYSRNITMIFKELLNNILKHADARHVKVEYLQPEKEEARIRITDDGVGFDTGQSNRGHGLNNVKARAKRMGGQMACSSEKGKGTVIELIFRINKKA